MFSPKAGELGRRLGGRGAHRALGTCDTGRCVWLWARRWDTYEDSVSLFCWGIQKIEKYALVALRWRPAGAGWEIGFGGVGGPVWGSWLSQSSWAQQSNRERCERLGEHFKWRHFPSFGAFPRILSAIRSAAPEPPPSPTTCTTDLRITAVNVAGLVERKVGLGKCGEISSVSVVYMAGCSMKDIWSITSGRFTCYDQYLSGCCFGFGSLVLVKQIFKVRKYSLPLATSRKNLTTNWLLLKHHNQISHGSCSYPTGQLHSGLRLS